MVSTLLFMILSQKESTKQRFASISFEYPNNQLEKDIIILESGTTKEIAEKLIKVSERTRNLKGKGFPIITEERGCSAKEKNPW